MTQNRIYSKFLTWSQKNDNIRAVILTSSRANPHIQPDILSDYDIELYVRDLAPFMAEDDWAKKFGSILVKWPLAPGETGDSGWITRLIQYTKGTRMDFQITTKAPAYHPTFDAGYQVLLDKDKTTKMIAPPRFGNLNIKKPSQSEYLERLNAFFWDCLYVPKNLWRGELFYTKFMLDNDLRFNCLQRFLEWFIGINHDWQVSTNKYGRWFKKYLSESIWKKVEATFVGASPEENWQALDNMVDLISFLAQEVAAGLGYPYPKEQEEDIRIYIQKIKRTKNGFSRSL